MNTSYPSKSSVEHKVFKTPFIFEEEKALNNKNKNISRKEQIIKIENGVKNGIYKSLKDIEEIIQSLFILALILFKRLLMKILRLILWLSSQRN